MEFLLSLLPFVVWVIIYRQASGKSNLNKWLVFVLALTSIVPSLIITAIAWQFNPRKKQGDSWTTALDGK